MILQNFLLLFVFEKKKYKKKKLFVKKFSKQTNLPQKGYNTLASEVIEKVWQERQERFQGRTKCKNSM